MAEIAFSCPLCKGHMRADQAYAHAAVQCPHCAQQIQMVALATRPNPSPAGSLGSVDADRLALLAERRELENYRRLKIRGARICLGIFFACLLTFYGLMAIWGDWDDIKGRYPSVKGEFRESFLLAVSMFGALSLFPWGFYTLEARGRSGFLLIPIILLTLATGGSAAAVMLIFGWPADVIKRRIQQIDDPTAAPPFFGT